MIRYTFHMLPYDATIVRYTISKAVSGIRFTQYGVRYDVYDIRYVVYDIRKVLKTKTYVTHTLRIRYAYVTHTLHIRYTYVTHTLRM
jgi:hypothetical protein